MAEYTTKHAITIAFDLASLESYTDTFLAQLWHVGQANPAPISDRDASEIVGALGAEIIKRWMAKSPAELYAHQAGHRNYCILSDHGHWPGPKHETWVYGKSDDTARDVGVRAARQFHDAVSPGQPRTTTIAELDIAINDSVKTGRAP